MTTAPTGTFLNYRQTGIAEILSNVIDWHASDLDPVFRKNMGAVANGSADLLGRNWLIHEFFAEGLAGVIEPAQVRGNFNIFGDPSGATGPYGGKLFRNRPLRPMPDAFEGFNALPVRFTIPMRGFDINFGMTLAEQQMDKGAGTVGSYRAEKLDGAAMNYARRMCAMWYLSQADSYRICALGPSSGSGAYTIDATNRRITFYPPTEVSARLDTGDSVDIVRDLTSGSDTRMVRINDSNLSAAPAYGDAVGQTTSTRIRGVVITSDPTDNRVVLEFDAADINGVAVTFTDWANTTDLGNNVAYIVFANTSVGANYGSPASSALQGLAGLNSYAKFGSTQTSTTVAYQRDARLLGLEAVGGGPDGASDGIVDIMLHTRHRSVLFTSVGQLTETKLGLYLDRFMAAKSRYGYNLDTAVWTRAALRSYLGNKVGLYQIDRTNRMPSLSSEGTPDEMTYTHANGQKYNFKVSDWQSAGQVDFYKANNNWTRYMPPDPDNVQRMTKGESFVPIKLLGPAIGGGSYLPYLVNSRYTQGLEMPGYIIMQLVPRQKAMLRLTGVSELRQFGTVSS